MRLWIVLKYLCQLSLGYITRHGPLVKEKSHVEYRAQSGSGRLRLASMYASPSKQQLCHSKHSATDHLVIASLDLFVDLCSRD